MIKPYKGGVILMPEGNPDLTYALVQYHNIKGKDLVSQMYDPFGYAEQNGTDAIANWKEKDHFSKSDITYEEEVLEYLKSNHVKYIITYFSRPRYAQLLEKEPGLLTVAVDNTENFIAYYVNQDKL